MKRILGLDLGQKTIGVAISDPLGFTAQGLTTIRRGSKEKDIEDLKKICDEYKVETIVIGLPKNMNGTIGPSGEIAMAFGKLLEEEVLGWTFDNSSSAQGNAWSRFVKK